MSVRVHRAADVHEQDHADVGLLGRAHRNLELAAVFRGLGDGLVEVELDVRPHARERAELAERHFDLPHVEHEVGPVRLVATRVGHAERAASSAVRADTKARWMRAARAEGASAAGSDPAVAAVVSLLLLAQALLEKLAELIEVERRWSRARSSSVSIGVIRVGLCSQSSSSFTSSTLACSIPLKYAEKA